MLLASTLSTLSRALGPTGPKETSKKLRQLQK